VPDIRNSRVVDIVRELASFGIAAQVHDPLALADEARHEYGIALVEMPALSRADAVILAVAHEDYVRGGWPMMEKLLKPGGGVVLDVKDMLDRAKKPPGVDLWRL
jgi:UDP-N-acetyl-D-galactosamine dehydrogenase